MSDLTKILIFTGAGCSAPLGLPVTTGFNSIIEKHSRDISYILLDSFLQGNSKDIEHILAELEIFKNKKTFLKHILQTGGSYSQWDRNAFAHVNSVVKSITNEVDSLIFNLKKGIFELLKSFNEEETAHFYFKLIATIKDTFQNCAISIQSTNYDLTFENAISDREDDFKKIGIVDFDLGFEKKRNGEIYNKNLVCDWSEERIEFKKLHGSLDWIVRSKKCVRLGDYTIPANPEDMLLLFPGFKGTPENEPYKSLHDNLLVKLSESNIAFVIGFAFRDPFINSIFETAIKINKDLIILNYNPCPLDSLPDESRIEYFIKNYPDNFIQMDRGVILGDKPITIPIDEIIKSLSLEKASLFARKLAAF